MKLFISIVFVIIYHAVGIPCRAQYGIFPGSARSQGMANIYSLTCDEWSGLMNQAGLAAVKSVSLGIHYENRFLVPEMGLSAFTMCLPSQSGTLALSYMHFGYAGFRESQAGLAVGKSFGGWFNAGVGLYYIRIRQAFDYGTMHTVVPAAGLQITPFEELMLAVHIHNPLEKGFSNMNEKMIPRRIQAGAGYSMGDLIHVFVETWIEKERKPIYNTGMEYVLSERFSARMGVSFHDHTEASFGMGFDLALLTIDLAAWYHPVLGFSPSVSVLYKVKDR